MILRDFQIRDSQRILMGLELRNKVAYTAPTGAGKTAVGVEVSKSFATTIVLTPTRLLAEQWEEQGMTAMTIQRALSYMSRGIWTDPALIIIDEAHHVSHNSYELFAVATTSKILGLSATYYRTSEIEGFSDTFKMLIPGPSRHELIEKGYVEPIEIHVPGLELPWDGEDLGLPIPAPARIQWARRRCRRYHPLGRALSPGASHPRICQ